MFRPLEVVARGSLGGTVGLERPGGISSQAGLIPKLNDYEFGAKNGLGRDTTTPRSLWLEETWRLPTMPYQPSHVQQARGPRATRQRFGCLDPGPHARMFSDG